MPGFEFACRACGASFDVFRQGVDATPIARCPIDGAETALQAIFGDSLHLRPPARSAASEQSRVILEASTTVEHTH